MNKLLLLLFFFSHTLLATELRPILIEDLKKVHHLEKRHDNRVLKLMADSSRELNKEWSEELVKELARVYSIVVKKNPNYFIVSVFSPILKDKRLDHSFSKLLSKKDYEHFLLSVKKREHEIKFGNH